MVHLGKLLMLMLLEVYNGENRRKKKNLNGFNEAEENIE